MRVNALTTQRQQSSVTPERRAHVERVHGVDTSFSSELSDHERSFTREQLQELLKQIDEQGARLTNTPTYDELSAYRSLVQDFIAAAVGQMYSLHTSAGWDRMGRQKVYMTVRKVDEELEAMAESIRLGQADALTIVARQGAIRGLLVDLYS